LFIAILGNEFSKA